MIPIIRYGSDSSFQLDPSFNGIIVECGRPRAKPLADCSLGVQEALAAPLGYPPLADITTEDDRIVLAVGAPLPRAAEIVAAVVQTLTDSGVNPQGIIVLQATNPDDDVCRLIPDDVGQRIGSVHHDPANRDKMAYLATTTAGQPVMLNRILTDADFVLPIGCVRAAEASGYFGVNSPLFPTFSDKDTQSRFRSADADKNNKFQLTEGPDVDRNKKVQLTKEADEVGWLLGVSFSIQVVPGSGDEILHVIAGEIGKVYGQSRRLFTDAWQHDVSARAKLVVATIEGGPEQQTWQNLGRAIANAATLVEEDGAIAVCCELAEKPGPAIGHLAQAASRHEALQEILENPPRDALSASQLAETLDRNHIYLMSKLDDSLLEELDITPIASPHEFNRLLDRMAKRDETCILLSNAAHANVTVTADE